MSPALRLMSSGVGLPLIRMRNGSLPASRRYPGRRPGRFSVIKRNRRTSGCLRSFARACKRRC
eukprot:scaffold1638_cov258-Pinguiococcus_pyrenoidosus.AAC.57